MIHRRISKRKLLSPFDRLKGGDMKTSSSREVIGRLYRARSSGDTDNCARRRMCSTPLIFTRFNAASGASAKQKLHGVKPMPEPEAVPYSSIRADAGDGYAAQNIAHPAARDPHPLGATVVPAFPRELYAQPPRLRRNNVAVCRSASASSTNINRYRIAKAVFTAPFCAHD